MKIIVLLLLGLSFSSAAFAERLIELRQDIRVAESIGYRFGPKGFYYQKYTNVETGNVSYTVQKNNMHHALGAVYGYDLNSQESAKNWSDILSNAMESIDQSRVSSLSKALNTSLNQITGQSISFSIID
ncbi:MAG: hypothetical protein VX642_03305 [Bdellovibrionota bacterium]|nr:hypothetical protein [Bdellovibrionota bacterium]